MTNEEAEEYAKEMTYRDAINNLMKARSIPYRKATFIKVNELLKALEQEPNTIKALGEDMRGKNKMYDIMIFIKGKVNGRKVTDLYRDNVLGYVIRNKYDPLTKSEYTEIEFCIKDNVKNTAYTEIVDIVGEFTVKIKEMKMTKDEYIKAYLNASEQIREVVENILNYTIDGRPATKEEIEKYIKEVYEKGVTHANMRGENKNG